MNINTKFILNDNVFLIYENTIQKTKIEKIEIKLFKNDIKIVYTCLVSTRLSKSTNFVEFSEELCFKTIEDLKNYFILKNNWIETDSRDPAPAAMVYSIPKNGK